MTNEPPKRWPLADRLHDHSCEENTLKTLIGIAVAIATGALLSGVADAQTARAELKDADGKTVGEAVLEQKGKNVRVITNFNGMPPGTHASHIPEVGKDNPMGPHAGDLSNVKVSKDGRAKVTATAKGAALGSTPNGLLDADGAALVVHEAADDYKSDPAGNAGKRIACGVIQPMTSSKAVTK